MRVLVLGGGGREHALIHALQRSPQKPELFAAPGNPGIAQDARSLAIAINDPTAVVAAAQQYGIDFVVPGPEVPLVAGVVDALQAADIACCGPTQAAARLEGSKTFAKQVMAATHVPTAAYSVVKTVAEGMAAITAYPTVIKADGLAAGKGVIIAQDEAEAHAALVNLLEQHKFGTSKVVIEEFLVGQELSLLALCDGERAIPLVPARDYKPIFDGDRGPNTGGMGAFSPVPEIPLAMTHEIVCQVHQPVVDYLRAQDTPFHGVLYAGLMLTSSGPKTLEFNVRFGDPETQAILPRLESDLLHLLQCAARPGGLAGVKPQWSEQAAVTVVLASAGYPESSSDGDLISGLEVTDPAISVTHAGTAKQDGDIVTAGGRVLNVTAMADTVAGARAKAYSVAEQINFDGKQFRTDIAAVTPEI